jgi:NAD+ kinase
MRSPGAPPKRIGIFVHPEIKLDDATLLEIKNYLQETGHIKVTAASGDDQSFRARIGAGEFDAVIALGGDGTMLRAGRLCAQRNVPVLGINMGHFGFLMELKFGDWRPALPRLVSGDYLLEDRMMLQVEHWRSSRMIETWQALNDVVVSRGKYVRPVRLSVSIDSNLLYSLIADGLIVATPTGSTAYALAAGGPILVPELHNILVVPLAPHLSNGRAVILSSSSVVTISVHTNHEAVLSVDGHIPSAMVDGDFVRVCAAEKSISFIRFQDPGYFYRNIISFIGQNPIANDLE